MGRGLAHGAGVPFGNTETSSAGGWDEDHPNDVAMDRSRRCPARRFPPPPLGLHHHAWAAGTGYLFVSSEKDHAVSVLDGESYALVKQAPHRAARPRHLRFTPDRSRIYVACGDGDAIDVIDVASLELVDRIGPIGDPEAFEFSPDGETPVHLAGGRRTCCAQLGILNLRAYFAGREEKPELTVAETHRGWRRR